LAPLDPPVFLFVCTYKITDFFGSVELYFFAPICRTLNYNLHFIIVFIV